MRGREISLELAVTALASGSFNLLRRGHDGSLVLSQDRWRCVGVVGETLRFDPTEPRPWPPEPLELALGHVKRATWDRLPRNQVRSEVRFLLCNGDILIFSGSIHPSLLDFG